MGVTSMRGGDDEARLSGIVRAFPQIRDGVLVDVGCRRASGRALAGRNLRYYGLDRIGVADVRADLAQGLPFVDHGVDIVLALDVLEHVDDIHAAFAEVCRVASRFLAITLPNVYEIKGRWRFLRGSPLSGKYGLPDEVPSDRHRWIFSLSEARRFCRECGLRCGFAVVAETCLVGTARGCGIGERMVARWPNLLAPTYGVLLQRIP
jgi:SAM-dependent methyltransferase